MIDVPAVLRSPAPIGARTAPNRFLAQPMEGNDGEDGGRPSDRTVSRYAELGRGKWGVAVVEAISVVPDCLARVNQLILEPRNLDGFKRLVGAYKEANPDGILLFQITHSGRKGLGGTVPTTLTEGGPAGARLLKTEEIEDIRRRFVAAARLAEQAGADGIDFKMCHGYFGAEMLRPSNVRADGWGGSFEDRTRFLRESIPEIRAASARADFLVGARVSLYEGIRGGCGTAASDQLVEDLSEMKRVIALMEELGMDYVNVSAGIPGETSEITRPVPQGRWFYLEHIRYSKTVSELLASQRAAGGRGRPAIVQSAYSILKADALALAAECVERGYSDFAGFGRQQFADPQTPAKLMRGEEPRWCVACSGCTRLMVSQVNDGCSFYNDYYKKLLSAKPGA
jgi:2,4-dienoyl-CoA reductase-like NADH-dependent reductase (Old Yellow Enzyme family)